MGFKHYDPTQYMSESEKQDYRQSCIVNSISQSNSNNSDKIVNAIYSLQKSNNLIINALNDLIKLNSQLLDHLKK